MGLFDKVIDKVIAKKVEDLQTMLNGKVDAIKAVLVKASDELITKGKTAIKTTVTEGKKAVKDQAKTCKEELEATFKTLSEGLKQDLQALIQEEIAKAKAELEEAFKK